MILKSLYINSFGNLKDFKFDFDSELSTVFKDNGFGKSTLAHFIKAMFYGLDGGRTADIDKSERKKYKPWNSLEKFGGYIIFNYKDIDYKITRYFGNKESEDEIYFADLKTGKQFNNNENLGERIFRVNEESFVSTLFFSQLDFAVKSSETFASKINDGEDIERFSKAVESLEKKAKEYRAIRGKTGKIYDLEEDIKLRDNKLTEIAGAESVSESLEKDCLEAEKEIEKLSEERNKLQSEKDKANALSLVKYKKERLAVLEKDYKEKQAKKDQLISRRFDSIDPDGLDYFKQELDATKRLSGEISVYASKETNEKKPSKILPIVLFSVSGLCLALGIFLSVLGINIVNFLFFGLFAVLLGIGALLITKKPNKESDGKTLELKRKELSELSKAMVEYLSAFNMTYSSFDEAYDKLKTSLNEFQMAQKDLEDAKCRYDELNGDPDLKADFSAVNFDVNAINVKLNGIEEELNELRKRLTGLKLALSENNEKVSEKGILESEKEDLEEKLLVAKDEYSVAVKTLEFLEKAEDNLKSRYKKPLEESFNKYVEILSGGKMKGGSLDSDLKVLIDENGKDTPLAYYSTGMKNLYLIAERLALIDLFFDFEKPFIVFDDPFSEFDDETLNRALIALKNLSKEYQIVYLCCHNSRNI